ncbi:P-type conjugative transfer protein VirB9 [Oligella urethralis]|uniref:Pertussis toxin liberation protein F n=1 Tax=Oligella urethralis TaxID=90245 RepID=A0A2N6QFB6_9BURK|nr:P-type conjugative transfer protein VirB9 [Oligella urethralis]PMC18234.1 P-type conjugative transfer protein VirB9 [Oligella urethralis]SPY09096.1 Pertussis toxin liberation protein F [Oligella urethralis]SUA61278.1 Pertussis toxin liberation protein F [Oligella urethralis]
MKKISTSLLKIGILAFALYGQSALALVIPQASKKDARIQTVTYSPYDVVNVRAKIGRAVLIQLEEDERLEGDSAALGMGDSEAWNLSVKGNNILFKPQMENPDTNMIVTTNKRTYVFQLSVDENSTQAPTYVLRFHYPDTAAKNKAAKDAKNRQALNVMSGQFNRLDVIIANDQYFGFGDKNIKPTAMYDDGRFTYLEFNHGKELPVVYKRMPDGTESLINMHVKGNTVVVHEMARDFVLRLGNSVLGIENRGFDKTGQFNHLGTSEGDAVRIIKDNVK